MYVNDGKVFVCLLVFFYVFVGRYYIGLTDWANEGVYRWKGNADEATYFNWMSGYPAGYNIEKNRDCVVLSTHPDSSYKKWTTVECSNSWSYICECESACQTDKWSQSGREGGGGVGRGYIPGLGTLHRLDLK